MKELIFSCFLLFNSILFIFFQKGDIKERKESKSKTSIAKGEEEVIENIPERNEPQRSFSSNQPEEEIEIEEEEEEEEEQVVENETEEEEVEAEIQPVKVEEKIPVQQTRRRRKRMPRKE